ncbi:MAG TPA: hypothetical protein VKZ63_01450 [Kofleriaceae bacterium]|nr:hypothetical protein [Kofleriaceae bacterium]
MSETKRFGSRGRASTGAPAGRPGSVIPAKPIIERNRAQPQQQHDSDGPTVNEMAALERRDASKVDPEASRRTVMIQAPAIASPMAVVQQPPQIDLVRHDLPEDSPIDRRLILVRDSDSQQAAAFRVLRHHLLDRGQPKVIAVSSPREREGKTTAAVNLALALAECGRARVLLVDGNLRRPELAGVFRFVPPWCFAEQLQVHREQPLLPWGVVDIPALWLHVAAINPRRDPGRLLDAPAFAIAMERLRLGPYDHIVVDCPSVLGGADVNLIQDSADGVILITRRKLSTARDLRQAVEQLTPARVLGTALLE